MKLQHDCFLMTYNYIRVNLDIIVVISVDVVFHHIEDGKDVHGNKKNILII